MPWLTVMNKVKELVPKVLPFVAVLIVGAGLGWSLKPDVVKVEERLKTVEVEKQVVVVQERVRIEYVKVKDTQVAERIHKERTEEKRPDGTVLTKETEDRNIDSVIHEKENNTEIKIVEIEKQVVVEKKVEVEKRIEPVLAQWRAGVIGGLSPQVSPSLNLSTWTLGAEVERRLAGPFWIGAWGMGTSTGQGLGGIKVDLEF